MEFLHPFPNSDVGARALCIEHQLVVITPEDAPRVVGSTRLGRVGQSQRFKDDERWTMEGLPFYIQVFSTSYGGRALDLRQDQEQEDRVILETLASNIKDHRLRWHKFSIGLRAAYPRMYAPTPNIFSLTTIPTVTLSVIARITQDVTQDEGRPINQPSHYLVEATFIPRPDKFDYLENCEVTTTFQPIQAPILL